MIHIVIVDDNPEDAAVLQAHLKAYRGEFNQELQVTTFHSGLDFIEEYRPGTDVVFFDIEMPGMDGMETAHELRKRDAAVGIIFITNMAQYAIRGYEVNAVDFMIKPVSYYNFVDKLQKAIAFNQKRGDKNILLTDEDGVIKIPVSDVFYIEKDKNYLIYHTRKGILKKRGTLVQAKEKLDMEAFSECALGFLVNLRHVQKIGKDTVIVHEDSLPVSRRLKKEFLQKFVDYMGGAN